MWKAEVIADSSGTFATNALLFEDESTAEAYARDLASRWLAVREWNVREATAEELERGELYVRVNGRFTRPAVELENLRHALRDETISYGELATLQELAPYIDPSDLELLEAAGVPEEATQ